MIHGPTSFTTVWILFKINLMSVGFGNVMSRFATFISTRGSFSFFASVFTSEVLPIPGKPTISTVPPAFISHSFSCSTLSLWMVLIMLVNCFFASSRPIISSIASESISSSGRYTLNPSFNAWLSVSFYTSSIPTRICIYLLNYVLSIIFRIYLIDPYIYLFKLISSIKKLYIILSPLHSKKILTLSLIYV